MLLQFFSLEAISQSYYSWDDANLNAARERKIILVEVIKNGQTSKLDKIIKDRNFSAFAKSMLIITKLTDKEIEFKGLDKKFLYSSAPFYATLMPYGDILHFANPNISAGDLMAMAQKSLNLAKIKRSNSKFVKFENNLEQAKLKAKRENKILCIYSSPERSKVALLMRQNIFSLDSVADALNSHIIFFPAKSDSIISFQFYNEDAKLLYETTGVKNKEQLLQMVNDVLNTLKVIEFQTLDSVSQNQKMMIIFYRQSDTDAKSKILTVFKDIELKKLLVDNYACIKINESNSKFATLSQKYNISSTPCICFISESGELTHKIMGLPSINDMLLETQIALNDRGLEHYNKEYNKKYNKVHKETTKETTKETIKENLQFIFHYLTILKKAGEIQKASLVANKYLSSIYKIQQDIFSNDTISKIFMKYYNEVNTPLFQYFILHKNKLYPLYTKSQIDEKIIKIWKAGATNFIKNGAIDENAFKNYTKRMKKAKVVDWRDIANHARLSMYKEVKDWKSYAELGELMFLDGKIPDKELYLWALAIKEGSKDELIRYKAAKCLDDAVYRIKKEEIKTGHVSLSSYKGFFEQLIKELVNN